MADRFDLRRDIQFNTRVSRASFDEAAGRWVIETGDGARVTATYCIMALGCLSSPNLPAFKGLETYEGERYHTGYWPHEEVDFTGKRVAVIGTGSSAVQSIPIIAAQAKQLTVFQRTANYAIPAHNAPLTPEYRSAIKADYPALRARARQNMTGIDFDYSDAVALETPPEERTREYERRWQRGGLSFLGAYKDLMVDQEANDTAADFVRAKIRGKVEDPKLAELLSPTNTIGCKRLCIDIGYYETFNRPNVALDRRAARRRSRRSRGRASGRRRGVRGRRDRVRHRLRRHDRRAAQDRHPRPGRPGAARQMARGAAHVSRAGNGGLPEPVHRSPARAAPRC